MNRASDEGIPPKNTWAPDRKFDPVTVTRKPPAAGPLAGLTLIPDGLGGMTTMVPLRTAASVPRLTAMFFGPSAAAEATASGSAALVGAAVDALTAKVGAPSDISFGLDDEN